MLEDSEAFYDTVRNLEQMAEDHLCFYGTGQDGGREGRAEGEGPMWDTY